MNAISKFIASIAALIGSVALLWIAYNFHQMTGGPARAGIDLNYRNLNEIIR